MLLFTEVHIEGAFYELRVYGVLGSVPIPLLSHSACRVLYGGTQAENKPAQLVGDRKFASDPRVTGILEA